jgi:flagellin
MAQVINTNIMSLNAQRNLNMTQTALATAMQRLSSGMRVNSAKDDAAGLAISERFTTQIRGLNQAVRNANDGISLSQTAEGAMAEMTNNLQRIRELAVQSANATNSASDREALDKEVQQRLQEVQRISEQTNFNGQKILDGTFGSAIFQVGPNVGDTIAINLSTSMKTTDLGNIATGQSTAEVTTAALSGTGTIKVGNGAPVTVSASVAGNQAGQTVGSAYAKAEAIRSAGVNGLNVSATNNTLLDVSSVSLADTETYQLRVNGIDIFNTTSSGASTITAQEITDAINASSDSTGVTAAISTGKILLTASDGRNIAIGQSGTGATGTEGVVAGTGSALTVNSVTYKLGTVGTFANATANSTDADAVNGGTLKFTAQEAISITGDGTSLGFASNDFTISVDSQTLSSVNIKTVDGANNTILRVDAALTAVSGLRSTFGAIQNRFESTIANLSTTAENLTASRSRIMDADFAAETAALSRAQILQQAGTAMVAQANQVPQGVLQLLQG